MDFGAWLGSTIAITLAFTCVGLVFAGLGYALWILFQVISEGAAVLKLSGISLYTTDPKLGGGLTLLALALQ